MRSKIVVRVKPYCVVQNKPWFVEDMKRFCGNTYRVIDEVYRMDNVVYFTLEGCGDWQFGIDGLEIL